MKEIKIGIQNNGYPCWLKGEVTLEELKKIIRLLEVMKEYKEKKKEVRPKKILTIL